MWPDFDLKASRHCYTLEGNDKLWMPAWQMRSQNKATLSGVLQKKKKKRSSLVWREVWWHCAVWWHMLKYYRGARTYDQNIGVQAIKKVGNH